MSTPQDRPGEDSRGTAGQPPPAAGAQAPSPDGASQQAPGEPYPYSQQPAGYAYSPYGYPLGTGEGDLPREPVRRPGIVVLALVLMLLSALPNLIGGLAVLLVPAADIPPDLLDDPVFADAGITPDMLVATLRVVGGVLLFLTLLYAVFAVLAFTGRNWARWVVAVMTAGTVLLLGFSVVAGGVNAGSALLVAILLLAGVGAGLLFAPAASRWYARR